MLKNINISNFYSIGEEQEMSMEITSKDILDESATLKKNAPLNLVSCIVGSNASGKTNLLKAFGFLSWFIEKSYSNMKPDKDIPIEPHRLRANDPTIIEVEFFEQDVLYKYAIELNSKEVLREFLAKKIQRMVPVFELKRTGDDIYIDTKLKVSDNDLSRVKARRNTSFLSTLIDLGYLPEITFFKNVEIGINENGRIVPRGGSDLFSTSQKLFKDEYLKQQILTFSNDVGLGIPELRFQQVKFPRFGKDGEEEIQILMCVHSCKKGKFELPIFEESNGTQQGFIILSSVLPVLKSGGLIILDEIEDGLHPQLAKKIISLFENKISNPNNAQLLFSTHQHLLLNDRTKTQIFIAEKSKETLETEVYRLDDVEGVRNDENYFHKYMAGAYGGTPNIKWM